MVGHMLVLGGFIYNGGLLLSAKEWRELTESLLTLNSLGSSDSNRAL